MRKLGSRLHALAGLLLAVLLLPLFGWLLLPLVPLPPALFAAPDPGLELWDRHGQPLRAVRAEDGPFRRPARYAEIPQPLVQATLAAEDCRFWRHPGVDWRATLRAAWQLAVHRRVVSGGSTITQQLIKLAQPRPRTLPAKALEALQALRLEQVWDKQRILREYLNRLDYGNFNCGCAAAAGFYFGKPLRDLSPAECALLAGLPQAPSRLNPRRNFDRARKRQQWILRQMRQAGWLSEDEFARAAAEPLRLAGSGRTFEAPHFVDLVLMSGSGASSTPGGPVSSLAPRGTSGERAGDRGSLVHGPFARPELEAEALPEQEGAAKADSHPRLRTTLDLELNRFVEQTVRRRLAELRAQQVGSAAAVIIENRSGDVLALVGSGDYFSPAAGQVNGAWAPRSAGSTFKPFTYLLAFGRGATPATVVADVPSEFATATGLFAPVNYNRRCYGPMRYRLALANSLNISAVKVLAAAGGPGPLQQLLRACGLTTLARPAEEYGLGLTIGNAEARLLELANAYACLARLGEYKPYRLVLDPAVAGASRPESAVAWASCSSVAAPRKSAALFHLPRAVAWASCPSTPGETPGPRFTGETPLPRTQRVANAGAAYLIADILSDNDARALAFGAQSPLRFTFPVACKTGTSSDFRDNWAFGYTPEFTVGVWAGNADGRPMAQVSGVTGAAPILHDLFERLHQLYGTTWYSAPSNIVECAIDPITGHRLPAPDGNPSDTRHSTLDTRHSVPVREKFLAGAQPPLARAEDYDTAGRPRLGREYRDWLASGDHWLAGRAVLADDAPSAPRIAFPPPGTILYLDPDLPGQGRRLTLRADGAEHLRWQSDSLQIVEEQGRAIALLTEGRHQIRADDPRTGAQARTWIEVRAR